MSTIRRRDQVGRYKGEVNPFPPAAPFPIFRLSSRSHQGAMNPARYSPHSPEKQPTRLKQKTFRYSKVTLYNAVFTPFAPQRTHGEVEEIQSTVNQELKLSIPTILWLLYHY